MKKDNKKALYESIMTSVAKEVKKVLNEGFDEFDTEDDIRIWANEYLNPRDKNSFVRTKYYNKVRDTVYRYLDTYYKVLPEERWEPVNWLELTIQECDKDIIQAISIGNNRIAKTAGNLWEFYVSHRKQYPKEDFRHIYDPTKRHPSHIIH